MGFVSESVLAALRRLRPLINSGKMADSVEMLFGVMGRVYVQTTMY